METPILKILGGFLPVDFTWGDNRRNLEERWVRWVRKYWLVAGAILGIFALSVVGWWLQLISFEVCMIINVPTFLVMAYALPKLGEQGRELRSERKAADQLLKGRIPVAVAAYQIKTLPGRILLLIRAGGEQDWSREVLVYDESVAAFLRNIFSQGRGLGSYVLVGGWEKTDVPAVRDVRLKEKEVFIWLDHSVGVRRVLCPEAEWWKGLEGREFIEQPPHG